MCLEQKLFSGILQEYAVTNEGNKSSSAFSVNQYFVDVDIYGTGMVIPVGKESGKNVGIGVNFVDYGRQIVRTAEMPEGTGASFGAHDLSIGISYAQKLTEDFYFGGTINLYNKKYMT